MATKIQIWNKALRVLGLPRLATVTDNVPTAYECEDVWATAPYEVLETGHWNFAIITLSSSGTTTSPIPGYTHRHSLPSAWVRTFQVSTTADFGTEADHRTENGYIYAQTATLYIRYLASTKGADGSISEWPPSFCEAVALRMAMALAPTLRPEQPETLNRVMQMYADQLARASEADEGSQHRQHMVRGAYLIPTGDIAQAASGALGAR